MRISDWSSDVCSSDLLGLAAHGEPGEAPLAEARVDAFAHGATPVDRLAMGALHAPAPGCNTRAVLGAGRIGIGLVLAARRRAVDPDASLGRPFGIVVLVKAAVDQMAPGPAAVALLQALKHRPHQAAVGAAGQRRDIDHDLALRHGGDLTVVGGPETAVGHLHDARLRIAGRGTRLFLLGDLGLVGLAPSRPLGLQLRSEEHTSELQSLMRTSYA